MLAARTTEQVTSARMGELSRTKLRRVGRKRGINYVAT
jgi:hypothetical protein